MVVASSLHRDLLGVVYYLLTDYFNGCCVLLRTILLTAAVRWNRVLPDHVIGKVRCLWHWSAL